MRLFGVYGCASGFATTPSSPAPSNSVSQRAARSGSVGGAGDVDRVRHAGEQLDQLGAPHLERLGLQVAVAAGEQVEAR